ncbi:MAG: hypothetical protein U5R06_09720 [candidate division KSB1 bacterium]|nr:hypothetical protein [candidate division KSB1 bacterium]
MNRDPIYIGNTTLQINSRDVQGFADCKENGRDYRIEHYDQMRPFFMNIVSDSDLWMFISSNGALTAGRRDPDHALFPYYTDDRIT